MRFSLLYEHQLPRPWAADSEHRLLKEALAQVELADRLGYDTVWQGEHHFLEEYSHSSASGVFLGAVAARTKNIRLGFGALPLPPGYQHPARVAEAAATLDLLSDGRVELGTGETSSGAELGGFGVERAHTRAQWAEALALAARMMVEEPFAGADGPTLTMPPRNVVPKPLQRPHPPLWVAGSSRETIRLAAESGLGALSLAFVEPEDAKAWVDEYYDIVISDRCEPAGFAINPNIAFALPMMVHDDETEAIERGIDGAHFLGFALGHYNAFGKHRPGWTSIWDDFLARREDVGFARSIVGAGHEPLSVKILQQGLASLRGAIGTPDQVRELVRRYEDAGVDELIFVLQSGKTEHPHIVEALELFARDVMPEFAARRPALEAAKRERLGDAPRRALARRPADRPVDRAYGFAAGDDGAAPQAASVADDRRPRPERGAALRRTLAEKAEQGFQAFVHRASDRWLEQTVGSGAGLRTVFGQMERQFLPERAAGFTGDIQYDLRASDGAVRSWTVTIDDRAARARPGASDDPKLTLKLTLADFARLVGRDLDPVKALLTGRLDLEGDFAVAARLGEMFGQPIVS